LLEEKDDSKFLSEQTPSAEDSKRLKGRKQEVKISTRWEAEGERSEFFKKRWQGTIERHFSLGKRRIQKRYLAKASEDGTRNEGGV